MLKKTDKIFKNAPIREALIDVRVNLPQTAELKTLEELANSLGKSFPQIKKRTMWSSSLTFSGEQGVVTQAPTEQAVDGFVCSADDGKRIVQYRLDGFTYSVLKPYNKWSTFVKTAKELWGKYRNSFDSVEVSRIAVRYINEINIPMPIKSLNDFFSTPPEVPKGLPQTLASYFVRYTLPFDESKSLAIVTHATKKPTKTGLFPFLLDIDVFRTSEIDSSEKQLWAIIEELRNVKNDIFFKSIKKKTEQLFEWP